MKTKKDEQQQPWPEPDMIQTVILVMTDGRRLVFSGVPSLKKGDAIRDIEVCAPVPLPPDSRWEKV